MSRQLPVVADTFVNKDLCGSCKGLCCQQYPGAAFPEDFGTAEEMQSNLLEAFMSGRWSIDKRPEGWYVRPAFAGPGFAGYTRCTFWSTFGCEIFHKRPLGCRGLEPQLDVNLQLDCKVRYGSEQDAIQAWKPHMKMLQALYEMQKDM
jgi:Fe-S-cluster containining protein